MWVKVRRTQYEYMSSALPSNSDIARRRRHFAFMPFPEVARISIDHLVGTQQERRRNGQAECACCIQVHDEFELEGLLDRQLSRLCATQNLVNEADDMAVTEQKPRSIS